MTILSLILREIAGMFVDDGFLAVGILAVVALAALLATLFHASGVLVGAVLIIGCIAVLLTSIFKAKRKGQA